MNNCDLYCYIFQELGVYNLDTKSYKSIDTGFTSHSCINIRSNGMIYCISGSPTKFSCVVQIDVKTGNVSILCQFIKTLLNLNQSLFLALETIFFMKANNISPDQTAPNGAI